MNQQAIPQTFLSKI